jgi:hypothetical protein
VPLFRHINSFHPPFRAGSILGLDRLRLAHLGGEYQ